jgi:hypothetical protein
LQFEQVAAVAQKIHGVGVAESVHIGIGYAARSAMRTMVLSRLSRRMACRMRAAKGAAMALVSSRATEIAPEGASRRSPAKYVAAFVALAVTHVSFAVDCS